MCLLPVMRGQAQQAAPIDVTNSAVAAVKALGEQVVLGKHKVAFERMYDEWKVRAAKQAGGMEKLQAQLDAIPGQMAKQGVQLISFKAQGEPTSYEVQMGKETVTEDGKLVEKAIYKKWLVLVPTVTEYRIAAPAEKGTVPKFAVIQSTGFQVAISDKDKNDWSFIDGASLTVAELRRVFNTLPENTQLPPIKRKQVEGK
ncbi:hypothetical protein [Luteolibacter soli]|uniref:Uncharacterized protein n=1 Tax=Luteolibacter soli TaxID=3135280 RepID=A0ABU9APH5_9BACT